MSKPQIFISYSHLDEAWKDRVVTHLNVLDSEFDVWVDDRIGAGDDWEAKIDAALQSCQAAVLLVTSNFLTSKFIKQKEVPERALNAE